MVQLYCLRCNHPNDADARYCSTCGAGLFRRFCPQCHTINGAESHFCQACGHSLPVAEGAPATVPPPVVPDLTDVVVMSAMAPPNLPAVAATARGGVAMPAASVPMARPAVAVRRTRALLSPAQLTVAVLAAGALVALTASLKLWPGGSAGDARAPRTDAPSLPAQPLVSVAPAAEPVLTRAVVPVVPSGPAAVAVIAAPGAATSSLAALPPPSSGQLPPPEAARKPAAPLDATAARAAAATTALALNPAVAARSRTAKPAAPAAAYECTAEVHALGLCAPGATIIRRP